MSKQRYTNPFEHTGGHSPVLYTPISVPMGVQIGCIWERQ